MASGVFPEDFVWGAATSAQQIEGGRNADRRRDSIWDSFAETPGAISDGSNPDVACDHYRRWRDDLGLMKWLGLGGYRFSISWPRVLPEGRGTVNAAGLDFYDALVDALLEADIEPFPTLYHWDLPQSLQTRGGWGERDTAKAFVEYSVAVIQRLGDRVRHWVTHNEPWCAATLGHEEGHHAPGAKDPALALRAAHHLLLSHGWACRALREEQSDLELGIVLIHNPSHAATQSEPDRDAARWFDGFFNRWYLDPLFRGEYPADAVADRVAAGHLTDERLPFVVEGDMKAISTPMDFLGVNYYSRSIMKAGPDGEPADGNETPAEERTEMGWEVYPDGLFESLDRIHRDYAPPKIFIAENGAAFVDPPAENGRIADPRRIRYLHDHLKAAHRAIEAGIPLAGYFAWSLLDNFEWGFGYEKRFGLFHVDFESQERTAKDSAHWYRELIAQNRIPHVPITTTQGSSGAHDLS